MCIGERERGEGRREMGEEGRGGRERKGEESLVCTLT